jgi:hypothetical protein
MQNLAELLKADPLLKLVDDECFVGWVYKIQYDRALLMTNDLWKHRAGGVPHNSFLTAAPFDGGSFATTDLADRAVLLFRVVGTAALPTDDDLVRAKIDHFQRQRDQHLSDLDDITQSQMQFGGLECQILGTFYDREGVLRLGSDQESFAVAGRLNVFRPKGESLSLIVNFVDPDVRRRAAEEAQARGIPGDGDMKFRLGTVRYTSTDRLHRGSPEQFVTVSLPSTDFLARRTAVFGMTRTGKSNTVKHLVSAVKSVADANGVPIGQLIYDLRGEYANPNRQDVGAISQMYPAEVECYRMLPSAGFRLLRVNFFAELEEGHTIIQQVLREDAGTSGAQDVTNFLQASLAEPDPTDRSPHNRWAVKRAAYQALLYRAGFAPPNGLRIQFTVSAAVRTLVAAGTNIPLADPNTGMTLDEAVEWLLACRTANNAAPLPSTGGGASWLDPEAQAMLNMLAQLNANGSFIRGWQVLVPVRIYHAADRATDLRGEIYDFLLKGRIVIIDLSVGPTQIRERLSQRITDYVFQQSMRTFLEDKQPPHIVIYVEEAHNLIGKKAELTDTWPMIAKEGAKFGIGFVYATQEPSSIHPNILSNTENWIVTHLNNDDELRTLAKFYDFSDFTESLKRASDVGFARVRTLSSQFVVPVQIDKFEPGIKAGGIVVKRSE